MAARFLAGVPGVVPGYFRVVRQILGLRATLESRVRGPDWRDSRAWDKSSTCKHLTNFNEFKLSAGNSLKPESAVQPDKTWTDRSFRQMS